MNYIELSGFIQSFVWVFLLWLRQIFDLLVLDEVWQLIVKFVTVLLHILQDPIPFIILTYPLQQYLHLLEQFQLVFKWAVYHFQTSFDQILSSQLLQFFSIVDTFKEHGSIAFERVFE